MLRLEMLPAQFGDALWLEYGNPVRPAVVIIDCGFKENYLDLKSRIAKLGPGQLELLVLTHVDDDHIRGAIPLLADPHISFPQDMDVWFNGWRHLSADPIDQLSAVQGEMFSALMGRRNAHWNALPPWGGQAIVVPDTGPLPTGRLPGGLAWTLLSPTWSKLQNMRTLWKKQVEAKGLAPGDEDAFLQMFDERQDLQPEDEMGESVATIEELAEAEFAEDNKAPNGSSIALLVEFEEKSVLLGGDAHPSVLAESLRRLAAERGLKRIALSGFKVAHHGSQKNTSPELLEAIDCPAFLFSSNGKKHGHPSPECVARIVKACRGATLYFNYESEINLRWSDTTDQQVYGYRASYPSDGPQILEF